MTFQEKIKMLRIEKNVTQAEVAAFLGITKQAYSLYELGKREPDNTTLYSLSDYFDVSLDYLLGKTDTKRSTGDVTEDDIKVALFGGADDVSNEMWDEVKNYIEYLKTKNKR